MVNKTPSHLVALREKQKPRVIHRSKRYVATHKHRRNTCVFSLVFALFIPSDKTRSCQVQHFVFNTVWTVKTFCKPYRTCIFRYQCKRYVSTVAGMMRYRPCSVGHFWFGHVTAVVREWNHNFILAPTLPGRSVASVEVGGTVAHNALPN